MLRHLLITVASMTFCCHALADAPSAAIQAEIDKLMAALESSGCEFNRNGSWYTAKDAKKHLLQKLSYINGRMTLKSTEQFIELGAATSSVSGKAYLVRCAGGPPIESQKWLLLQLKEIRGPVTSSSPGPK